MGPAVCPDWKYTETLKKKKESENLLNYSESFKNVRVNCDYSDWNQFASPLPALALLSCPFVATKSVFVWCPCLTCIWTQGGARGEEKVQLTFDLGCSCCWMKAEQVGRFEQREGNQVVFVFVFFFHCISMQLIFNYSHFSMIKIFYKCCSLFVISIPHPIICVSTSVICWWNVFELSKDVNQTQKHWSVIAFLLSRSVECLNNHPLPSNLFQTSVNPTDNLAVVERSHETLQLVEKMCCKCQT